MRLTQKIFFISTILLIMAGFSSFGQFYSMNGVISAQESGDNTIPTLQRYIYDFDGDSQYVSMGNRNEYNITGTITISFWMYLSSSDIPAYNGAYIVSKTGTNTAQQAYFVRIANDGTGRLQFGIFKSGVEIVVTSVASAATDGWVHFACIHYTASGNLRIYRNGATDGLSSGLGGFIDSKTAPLYIGRRYNNTLPELGDHYFKGRLYDVQIWNQSWNVDDVFFYYTNKKSPALRIGTNLTKQGMVFRVKTGERYGNFVFDSSGNDFHGTAYTPAIHAIDMDLSFYIQDMEGYARSDMKSMYYDAATLQDITTDTTIIVPRLDHVSCRAVSYKGVNTRADLDYCSTGYDLPESNILPIVAAGPDRTITLPTSSVQLFGSAIDNDGYLLSRTWTKISGGSATITNGTTDSPTITGLSVSGTYVFRYTATDNSGGSSFDEMTLTVQPEIPAFVATYYVSTSGNDANTGTLAAPFRTIAKANSVVVPGNIVALRGGTYTNDPINPSKSGTASNPITYVAYPGEVPTLSNASTTINLNSRSFIVIDSIRINGGALYPNANINTWLSMVSSTDCIIRDCRFQYGNGYNCIFLDDGAKRNIFQYNDFDACGTNDRVDTQTDHADMLAMWCAENNLIEYNRFTRGGHNAISIFGSNNVISHNVFDQLWSAAGDSTGNRALTITDTEKGCNNSGNGGNVFEYNVVVNTMRPIDNDYPNAVKFNGTQQLIRRNYFFRMSGAAFTTNSGVGPSNTSIHSRIYNNTFHRPAESMWRITSQDPGEPGQDIILKNNISYNAGYNAKNSNTASDIQWDLYNTTFTTLKVINNLINNTQRTPRVWIRNIGNVNITTAQVNYPSNFSGNLTSAPVFVNYTPSDTSDLHIQAGSPAIDAGSDLAVATNSGAASTTLVVDDAYWFSDGRGIVLGDYIVIGTTGNRITAINYTTKTITLQNPATWSVGAKVNLPFYGVRPDIGAHERP